MFEVTQKAYAGWPEKYRPQIDEDTFEESVYTWESQIVYGAFEYETGILEGYAYLSEFPEHLEFSVLRVNPECESSGINAAVIVKIINDYNDKIGKNFYINDGSRSILHETAFQDYLEKYFGFRKAYCKLNICYRFPVGIIVRVLYPFRNCFDVNCKIGSLITGVLKMEEIKREK